MDREVVTGLVAIAVGLLFCWLAIAGWRTRAANRISLLEAAILRTTGADPLPLNRIDHALQLFHLVMMSIFGPALLLLGLAFLLT